MESNEPKTSGTGTEVTPKKHVLAANQNVDEYMARLRRESEIHWYGLRVSAQHERKLVELLTEKKIEAFVPTRKEKHRWSDRMKVVEQVLTPSIIFVRISMARKTDVFVSRDIKSYVYAPGVSKPSPISDASMDDFMRLVQSEYEFKITLPFVGDTVMVLDGPMRGVVGDLVKIDKGNKKPQLVIKLNDAFGALFTIDAVSVSKVPKGTVSIPAEHVPDRI